MLHFGHHGGSKTDARVRKRVARDRSYVPSAWFSATKMGVVAMVNDHSCNVSQFWSNPTCLMYFSGNRHSLLFAKFPHPTGSWFMRESRRNLNLKHLLIYRRSPLMTWSSSHSEWGRDFDVSSECDKMVSHYERTSRAQDLKPMVHEIRRTDNPTLGLCATSIGWYYGVRLRKGPSGAHETS